MDKILIEAVKRLYRKELKELESQRNYISHPALPLSAFAIKEIERLDLEIEEVGTILEGLEKLG